MNQKRYDALVIGAGVNGLTAAVVLARAGKKVLILERADAPGGQAAIHEFAPGFRTAPLGHSTGWLSPAVVRATGITAPGRVVPDCPLSVRANRLEWLPLHRDPTVATEAIRQISGKDAARWGPFCELVAKLSGFLAALYQLPPPQLGESGLLEMLPLLRVARRLRGLGREDMVELLRLVPMPVQELLDEWFQSAPLKAAVGAIGVTGIRQGPRSGGTAFVLLHHLVGSARRAGAMGSGGSEGYWEAGPLGLIDALLNRSRQLPVEIRTGASVSRILVQDERVTGVTLQAGDEYAAPLVLSSADPARTMLSLLDPIWLDPDLLLAVRNIKFRGSTSVISYGLDGLPSFDGWPKAAPLTGAISLTGSLEDLDRAADAAKYGRTSERPFITLRLPSLRWPGTAPDGKHVLTALVQWTPAQLREGKWDQPRREALERSVTSQIEQAAPGFGNLVRAVETLTPADLEARYGLTEGAPSHGEITLDQILFMRPVAALARYATPVAGLYLCGAGCHPGPGIVGGPGWLAARTAVKSER